MQNQKTLTIVTVAVLIAMEIVLTRFLSISTGVLRIGFGFVPIAICAMMFGPLWAGAAGAIADVIGITLVPIGAFFPGFTLSAALVGVIFGLFLHKSKGGWIPIFFATGLVCFVESLFLRTFWLSIIWGTPFFALLPTRLLQSVVMFAVQFVTLNIIEKSLGKRIRERGRYTHQE